MWVNFKMTQSWSRVSHILWLPGETEDQEAIRDDVSTSFWVYDPWRAKSTLDATPKDYRLQAAQVLGLGRATWSWTLSPGVSWPRQGTNSPGCPPNFGGWTHRLLLPVTRPSVLQEWSPVFGWMTTKAHSGATKPGAVRSPWQDKPRAVLSLTGQVISRALLDLTSHELCSPWPDKPWAMLSLTWQAMSYALDRTSHEPRSPWQDKPRAVLWLDKLGEVDPEPAAPTSQGLDQSTVMTLASPVALATPPTSVSLPSVPRAPLLPVSWQLFSKRWARYDL